MGTRTLPGGKAAGVWVEHPTPSIAEAAGVQLYLYSPSGPSWHLTRWTLTLPHLCSF